MTVAENMVKWQNYAHYILNALALTLEVTYLQLPIVMTLSSVLITSGLILANDTLIHAMFENLPEPFKWSD